MNEPIRRLSAVVLLLFLALMGAGSSARSTSNSDRSAAPSSSMVKRS